MQMPQFFRFTKSFQLDLLFEPHNKQTEKAVYAHFQKIKLSKSKETHPWHMVGKVPAYPTPCSRSDYRWALLPVYPLHCLCALSCLILLFCIFTKKKNSQRAFEIIAPLIKYRAGNDHSILLISMRRNVCVLTLTKVNYLFTKFVIEAKSTLHKINNFKVQQSSGI